MTQLQRPQLGTSRDKAPVNWVLHETGSYLVGDLFFAGYYRDCLQMAEAMAPQHRPSLTSIHAQRKSTSVNLEGAIAKLEDVSRWAGQMRSEDYHTVNTHVFVSLWSAHESGNENVIAEILRTDAGAAEISANKFKVGRYKVDEWPWSEETCLEIAQKLDVKAKTETLNGGWDACSRFQTLFSWFELTVSVDACVAMKYNEAAYVRNVILHRYGRLGPQDAVRFPELAPWVGEVLPIDVNRLLAYHQAIVTVHLAGC